MKHHGHVRSFAFCLFFAYYYLFLLEFPLFPSPHLLEGASPVFNKKCRINMKLNVDGKKATYIMRRIYHVMPDTDSDESKKSKW
jgi:hypothetical protein